MKNLTVKKIIEYTKGVPHNCDAILDKEAVNVAIDSRLVKSEGVFVALKGEKVDGHKFIPSVMDNGALIAISEQDLGEVKFPYIKVENTHMALQHIARAWRECLNCKFIGISGSVGKTSTKEMVASILQAKFNVVKTEGNFNNEIGVPLTLFNVKEDTEVAVVEMGINHFGEMTRLATMVQPDVCILTNIGDCHLEFLGDRDGVYKAKSEMFPLKNSKESPIILNGDDAILKEVKAYDGYKTLHFTLDKDKFETETHNIPVAYATSVVNNGLDGIEIDSMIDCRPINVHINVPGNHMASNFLAGAVVGIYMGMSASEIKTGAENAKPIAGRGRVIKANGYEVFDDCYNANPASMRSSLNVLATTPLRRVAILGDMGELGDNKESLHYGVGEFAANDKTDILVCIGALAADIYKGFNDNNKDANHTVYYYETKEEFLDQYKNILKEGDAVLVKASHFMEFGKIVEKLTT